MKQLLNVSLVAMFLLVAPAFGDEWSQSVDRWSDTFNQDIGSYHEECKVVTSPSTFPRFMQDVFRLKDHINNLKRYLSRGHDYCLPHFGRVQREFESLQRRFESRYSDHPNFRVRLGWHLVELSYLELESAFTAY